MTTTLVFGDPSDGYLHSTSTSYATARNGPASQLYATAQVGYYGQNNNAGGYAVRETFIRFTYPAVGAQDLVTSAAIRTYQVTHTSTSTARDMEIRNFGWDPVLEMTDWRNPSQLAAAPLYAKVGGVQAAQSKWTTAGSEALRALVQGSTSVAFVVTTSRVRAGSTPTSDETSGLALAETAGTSQDPCLVYVTTPLHALVPVMGMEAQLSDGSWIFGVRPVGTGAVTLYREDQTGAVSTVGSLPIGNGSGEWADVQAAQGLSLAVDDQDHFYVTGRAGDAPNSIRQRAYVKASGSWSWTAGTTRTVALPAHDTPVNNVTAAWHPTAGGTLVVFAAHTAGECWTSGMANDVAWALISTQYLLTGSGTQLRASGSAINSGLLPASPPSGELGGFSNETGSGLDVVADRSKRDWGYLVTFRRSQRPGDNALLPIGRYQLQSNGAGFSFATYAEKSVYGRKDGSGKARILAVGPSQVAVVTADADAGYGLTVQVLQSNGATSGWVSLGYVALAQESVANMPDGPAVASALTWDAVYSAAENAVWVYFTSATDPTSIRRTSVSLTTYQATRVSVAAFTASGTIRAIRAPRNAWVTSAKVHLTVAVPAGYQRVVDTLNLAPSAPTLTTRTNYDATTAATFSWTFRDPNAGDAQSAFQLQVVRASDGVTVHDTGKVTSTTSSRTVAGGTLANGQDYRWRVMTWDTLGLAGPWSSYSTFTTSAGGTVTITDPAEDNPPSAVTDDYEVSWSVAGTTQSRFRIWVTRNDTGAIVFDSTFVTSTTTSRLVTGMVAEVEHTIRVQVENASAVRTNAATRLITPSYGSPEAPIITVEPHHDQGHVLVMVTNPPPGFSIDPGVMYDFEDGTTEPWTSTSMSFASSTAQAHRGTRSIQMTSTATPTIARVKSAQAKAVTPGQRYVVSFWCYSPAGYNFHAAAINWRPASDPAGATISTSTGPATVVPPGQWTLVSVSAQAPAGAGWAVYGPGFAPSPSVGYVFFVDELTMRVDTDRPEAARNRIFRRRAGTQDPWEDVGTCDPNGTFQDYTAPGGVPVEYMARGES